jgi:hypothetical protein
MRLLLDTHVLLWRLKERFIETEHNFLRIAQAASDRNNLPLRPHQTLTPHPGGHY